MAFFKGNTPALNLLGGFKESCSKAYSSSRTCDDILNEIRILNISSGSSTQRSGQMRNLFHNFPLIIGENFSSEKENEEIYWAICYGY